MILSLKLKEKLTNYLLNVFMLIVMCITMYPIIYVISISLSSTEFVQSNQVVLLPKGFNFNAYMQVASNYVFWNSYKNTLIYTISGVLVNMLFTSTLAFGLSRKELVFRKQITFFIIFTMYFGGGLISSYLLVNWLKMYNTIWALIIPTAISTYNLIIMKTYMQGIPEEIIESVRIEGGNDLQIFVSIILPLSKPVLATIGLFYAVAHWNAYFVPMIYLKDKLKYPVQLILKEMIVDRDLHGLEEAATSVLGQQPPTSGMLISATVIVALIPILCVYPFIQRYFVKGVMIGSLKG